MKIQLVIGLVLISTGMNSFACEFHSGFGFGSFGQFHPLAQQHIDASEIPELEIIHESVMRVTTDTQATLKLKYLVPKQYENAEITFSSSDNLLIADSSSLSLTKSEGDLDLSFRVTHPGQHSITVRVDARQNYRPVSKIQRISVISD